MGAACQVLPIRNIDKEYRAMVHKAVDEVLDKLEAAFEENPSPTLKELSGLFQEHRSGFLSASMKATIARLFPSYVEQLVTRCPCCNKLLHRKRFEPKELSTLQGSFVLQRPYFYCAPCRVGFHPLDEILQLAEEFHQHDIQECLTDMAARMPYREAAEVFQRATGIPVGNHCAHNTLNTVAESASVDRVIPDAKEIRMRIEKVADATGQLPILAVCTDGAHTPTRARAPRAAKRGKGSWQEAKGFRLYLLDSNDRICHIASWHQIQDRETIGKALQVAASRIPKDKLRVVLLGDGASWVWNAMVEHFPQARQILDFYHAFEHLFTVAKLQYADNDERSHEWAEATMIRLCEGGYRRVMANLRLMKPRSTQAEQEITKLINYLDTHGTKMNYGDSLAQGYPIGSGGIESANKFICHTRLKRSGAWWVDEMANAVLRIRCAQYNGTFDTVFNHYMKVRFAKRHDTQPLQNE
jgi:hypothetical protein